MHPEILKNDTNHWEHPLLDVAITTRSGFLEVWIIITSKFNHTAGNLEIQSFRNSENPDFQIFGLPNLRKPLSAG